MSTEKKPIPLPKPTSDTKQYWDGAAQGKLLIKQCNACHQAYFFPRPLCPFCMSEDTEWLNTSGQGTVYSYTSAKRASHFNVPALITLDEGPTIMSAVVGCEKEQIYIGQRVHLEFVDTEGDGALPVFTV